VNFAGVAGLSIAAAVGGLYATDALTRGEVYDLPFEQVYSELAAMPLPGEVTQVSSAGAGETVEVRRDPDAIHWIFLAGGEQTGRFTAQLSREGAQRTRVIVDFEAGPALTPELAPLSESKLMRKLAAAALAEQVDSRLERRPFEASGFMTRAAEHLQNNPQDLEDYGASIRETMVGLSEQIRANSEGLPPSGSVPTYQPQPVGKPNPDATRPSLDLSRN
jgi:hypothetical protein